MNAIQLFIIIIKRSIIIVIRFYDLENHVHTFNA
jgi:hypothetical protein